MDESAREAHRQQLGQALRLVRLARALTQEDFSLVSSRTYLSSLERGNQTPTLEKLAELAAVLQVHPATVLVLADALESGQPSEHQVARLLERIGKECAQLRHRLPSTS